MRGFGLVMLAAGALGAAFGARHGWPTPLVVALASVGAMLAALALVAPAAARPLHAAWMTLGERLGRVTSPVALALVFFGVFVPLRALLWLLRVDLLGAAREPGRASYWIEREAREPTRADFERTG